MRGEHAIALVGNASSVDPYVALATLRTLRGKLTHAAEVNPDVLDRMNLTIDAKPPGGGEIGGDSLTITPQNFGIVNEAFGASSELPILLELVPPTGWRSETEIGRSIETVAQLLPRVDRAIASILARVYAGNGRAYGRGRAQIGAVAAHLWADRDSAGAAIDAQIIAMARAVVTAAGGDASVIRSRAQGESSNAHEAALSIPANVRAAYAAMGVPNVPQGDGMSSSAPSSGPASPGFAVKVLESRAAIDRSPFANLWYNGASPLLDEWNSYYADKRHWYDAATEVMTSWEDYVGWAKRVNAMRRQIEKAGIHLAFPPLAEFPKSFQDNFEDLLADALKMAKYGLIGLGVVVGTVVIAKAVKD